MAKHNMNQVRMLEFAEYGDNRGHLVIIEGEIDIAGQIVKPGDAYLFDEDATIVAKENSQFIWFDLNN